MNKNFTPACDHHLQMMSTPHPVWYQFGCSKCPGRILIPAKDTKGKTIETMFAGVLEMVA